MKLNQLIVGLFLAFAVLAGTSCKSEFETVRTSGDVDLIYKTAEKMYKDQEYEKAQSLYELIIPAFRGRPELEEVYYKYALTYFHLDKFILASYYFKNFVNTFPNSTLKEEVSYMEAFSYYQLSPSYRLDQTNTEKAIDALQTFINTYPNSERVAKSNKYIDQLRKKLEIKALEGGKLYYDLKQYQSATQALTIMLKDYPETTNAEEVRYLIAKSAYNLAANSVYEKRAERYEEAVKYADAYLKKFKGKNAREIRTIRKDSIDNLKKLTDG